MKINTCRLCLGNLSEPKLKFPNTPLANELAKTDDEKQDLFPLQVCVCETCAHYQLNESIDPERLFRNDYPFVAGTSPVNVEHFRKYASDMITKFDLKPDSKVLDIASNDGTLLKHFKNSGMFVLGIDPATDIAAKATEEGIKTIPEFFTEIFADEILNTYGQFDLITANNVFAHVPNMIGFVKGVKKLLAPQGVFTFEVSYFADVCDKIIFDTIYHEHSSYHTLTPLFKFFVSHELELFDAERITNHGGSIRIFVRNKEDAGHGRWHPGKWYCLEGGRINNLLSQEDNIADKVSQLHQKIKYLGLELRDKLRDYKEQNKSVAIYGVPAKATTLMYALGIKKEWIDFAVEDNPLKIGKFSPGLHIPILNTEAIYQRQPDCVLILAWNFADSIIDKIKKQWCENFKNVRYPTFIVPLPELKIERYCENKTCTCGTGPWDDKHQCSDCGGFDHGIPSFGKI